MCNRKNVESLEVWLLPLQKGIASLLTTSEISNLLNSEEYTRFANFKIPSKQDEFLASRLLLRYLLRQHTDLDPGKVVAAPDEFGRPFWKHHGTRIPLYFSLSHTRGMVCCVIGNNMEIGCDVELIRPRKYERNLAEKIFSSQELSHYLSLPEGRQRTFFYTSWTLKEAFVKAVGKGLRIPLGSLSFTQSIVAKRINSVPNSSLGLQNESEFWSIISLPLESDYLLACATANPVNNLILHRLEQKHTELHLLRVARYS